MSKSPARPRTSPLTAGTPLRRWALLLALGAIWEAATRLALVDALILPPLSRVLVRGWQLLCTGRLLADLTASAGRVLLGFIMAAVVAFPAGVAMGLYAPLEEMGSALLSLLRPLSPPAWIPLAILWFGIGDAPALFIIFVGTFFSLLVGTVAATKAVSSDSIKVALTLGATRWQSVRHVVLPSLLPAFLAQARIGLGLAWMCVIAAEMVAVRRGVGFLMVEARNLFRTEDVIVGMISIGLVGVGTDWLFTRLEERLFAWRRALDPSRLYV